MELILKLTQEEIQTIIDALSEKPFNVVYETISKIISQVDEQTK